MMTSYRNHFIRLGWQSAHYQSIAENSSGSEDHFQLLDLTAQYYLTDRLKLWANMSYRTNERYNSLEHQEVSGISDSRIMVNYSLVNNYLTKNGSSWLVDMGLGLKIPTGKYNPDIHDSNLPENFNIGNGHVGFLFQPRAVFTKNSYGIVFSNHNQINTASRDGYQYGSQFSAQLTFFKEQSIWGLDWIPQLGLGSEYIQRDHYKNGNSVHGTGGKGVWAMAGLSVKWANYLIGVNHSLPMVQNYSQNEVEAQQRWAIQASFIF
ncbi:hypothetical protein GCM10025777_26590 [Membranihabitans marinus]